MQPFKNILVALNSEAPEQVALQQAVKLAANHQARLKLVDVVREFNWLERLTTPNSQEFRQGIADKKTVLLEKLAEPARAQGLEVTTVVLSGKSSLAIVREVLQSSHDLVVKQAKGAGWFKGFYGATGMQLLRKCPCPVWLTKPEADAKCGRVMAAVDANSPDEAHAALNRGIIDAAQSFGQWENAQVHVVQAWNVYGEDVLQHHMLSEEFEELMQRSQGDAEDNLNELLRDFNLNSKSQNVHILHGDPSLVIPQFAEAERVDLIVMGTIARTGLAGALMGNTAEAILANVHCSILALKPKDFVSPIGVDD